MTPEPYCFSLPNTPSMALRNEVNGYAAGLPARESRPPLSIPSTHQNSNNARLNNILQDPALRLLFREFLRYSLCEENLSFYIDVSEFTKNYRRAEKAGAFTKMDAVRETLASAYGQF